MSENNRLRDDTGALIGGLVVFDYLDGIADYKNGIPPKDITTPSYDLGRQRAAEHAHRDAGFKQWLEREEQARMARLKSLLPPDAYAELEQKLAAIRKRPPAGR